MEKTPFDLTQNIRIFATDWIFTSNSEPRTVKEQMIIPLCQSVIEELALPGLALV